MGSGGSGTPNRIQVSGSPVFDFKPKEPCFDPHPGGLGAHDMNATFTNPLAAVKYANKYERMGYVVTIEARGERLFVTAYKACAAGGARHVA